MIIYKTTNLINGKIYIGKDTFNDPTYLGSGLILKRSIKKHGVVNFRKEIIEHCSSKEELDKREIFWIKELNSTDRNVGYNIAIGGSGGDTYSHQSEELKIKRIKKWWESAKHTFKSEEFRKKHADIMHKKWEDPMERQRMSDIMKNREIKWKDKITNSVKEWHKTHKVVVSDETKQKISKKMLGYEFKSIPDELQDRIKTLYQTIGPKLIADTLSKENIEISPFLIIRFLKKEGVYQRYKKGIGDKLTKHSSLSRKGSGNPMWNKIQSLETIQKRITSLNNTIKHRDANIRTFENIKTGELFVGTAYDFRFKYNISYYEVRKLVKGIRQSTFGWKLRNSP